MTKLKKKLLKKAFIAGFFSTLTIGVLAILTYKSPFGLFIAASFGSSMVLLFGFPESPFAQPKNVFFGHLVSACVGVFFCKLNTITNLYKYCICCWNRNFFNDFARCSAPSCWWKPYTGNNRKCLL